MTVSISLRDAAPLIVSHRDLLHQWMAALEFEAAHKRRSSETVRTYRTSLFSPSGWLSYLLNRGISQPTSADVYAFISEARLTRSAASCNCSLSAIRSCYAWLDMKGLYAAIGRGVPPFRLSRLGPKASLSAQEVGTLCTLPIERRGKHAEVAALRDTCLIRILYGTGIRLISLVRAERQDVVRESAGLYLRHQPKGHQSKDALVAIPLNASRSLEAYLQARNDIGDVASPLFASLHPIVGRPLDASSLRRIVYRYLESAGIRKRDAGGELISPRVWGPHMLRRSAAVHAIDSLGLEAGQILLAHASSDQTRRAYAAAKEYQVLAKLAVVMDLT